MANVLIEVIDILKEHYEDCVIKIDEVKKVNDVCLTGITILKKGEKIAPVIYVDDLLERYNDANEIAEKIIDIYENNVREYNFIESIDVQNFESVKEHLTLRICNRQSNEEFLKDKIWYGMLDLAVYAVADYDEASITLTKNMAENCWEVSEKELLDLSLKNFNEIPASIRNLLDAVKDITDLDDIAVENCKMFVVTNKNSSYGAVEILNVPILESISDKFGSDLCILPSSVHEIIVIPIDKNIDFEYVNSMIKSVNETNLSPKDVLSDHAYVYIRSKKMVDLVENYAHF